MQQAEPVYAATPATIQTLGSPVLDEEPPLPEEPPDDSLMGEEAPVSRPMTQPARQRNGNDTRVISAKQVKRLYAITENEGIRSKEQVDAYIKNPPFGYNDREDIQRSHYEQICDYAEGQDV